MIDSILRGWKLPKFYFLKTGDSPIQYEVVDGQQRLAAIFEFLDDELNLSAESQKLFGARKYSELDETVSDAFDDFEIEFDEIEEATEEEIKEFFQRLQEGLPLTGSEKLNSVHSKLRDFCKKLAKHSFFTETVSLSDRRYAHFDVTSKTAAIEVEGIEVGLRYEDLRAVFQNYATFSANSLVARRLREALNFLWEAFPAHYPHFRNRSVVQSVITLVCSLAPAGKVQCDPKKFGAFIDHFMTDLSKQVELGHRADDADFIEFQSTINANVRSGASKRQNILVRKLLRFDPTFMDSMSPVAIGGAAIAKQIASQVDEIKTLVVRVNEVYAAVNGKDLIKPTNKTVTAQTTMAKTIADVASYKEFIDSLYFLFWEGPGPRLVGNVPASFTDLRDLRTLNQHDVEHGKSKDIAAKRKALSAVFKRYSGSPTPATLAVERFPVLQLNLLSAIAKDLRTLIVAFTVP